MSQVLYHFTAAHCIEKIRRQGLTKGALPWDLDQHGNPTFRHPFQWLTTNANFGQPWCLLGELPFSRNAWRITVCVPTTHEKQVLSWPELCRRCQPQSAEELNRTGGDVQNWRLF